jgi:predicted nucleic acid-binding protein
MLVVDASCLYEVVGRGRFEAQVQHRIDRDPDRVAPHVIDVEVMNIIRREYLRGNLDETNAYLAVQDLRDWPGERFGHRMLLERAWQLREKVRGWDALYVSLAEALDATLITLDGRLARAPGLRCAVELLS